MEDWDPRKDDYEDKSFNSYTRGPGRNLSLKKNFVNALKRGPERGKMEDWDPRKDDYEDKSFNSYTRGPGRNLSLKKNFVKGAEKHVELYVTGIPQELTEDGMENLFGRAGTVERVRKMKTKRENSLDTFGFVTMGSINDADQAIAELDGFRVGKFSLRVSVSLSKEDLEWRRQQQQELNLVTARGFDEGSSDSESISKMNEKYLCHIHFVTNTCPIVLREVLESLVNKEAGDWTPEMFIKQRHSEVRLLLNTRRVSSVYREKLFPPNNQIDIASWDLTLLDSFIRNLFQGKLRRQDLFALDRIRCVRNELMHVPGTNEITDQEFDIFCNELEFSTMTLTREYGDLNTTLRVVEEIKKLKTGRLLDYSNVSDTYRAWYKETQERIDFERMKMKEEMDKFRNTITDTKQKYEHVGNADATSSADVLASDEKRKRDEVSVQEKGSDEKQKKDEVSVQGKDEPKLTWHSVKTKEDALILMQSEPLPDQQTLEYMVEQHGKKSDQLALVCEKICQKLKEETSDDVHIFAAYSGNDDSALQFVLFKEDEMKGTSNDTKLGYRCIKRGLLKSTPARPMCETEGILSPEESETVRKTIKEHSAYLMKTHRYLSAISARKIERGDRKECCIVLYVHPCTGNYTSVPIEEDPLPETIGNFRAVVRHGVFNNCVGGVHDFHDHVRIGCKITSNYQCGFGTLGGFVDHHEYGLCGITCAHVVFNVNEMHALKRAKRKKYSYTEAPLIYQPDTNSESIGRIVEAAYTEGGDTAGIDLALFQIENRHPDSGVSARCQQNEPLNYDTGKIWVRTRVTEGCRDVQKIGMASGFTRGKIVFDGMAVKELNFATKVVLQGIDSILYNQYEIACDGKDFCQEGDSGGLVFMKDHEHELVCLGMINGVLNGDGPRNGAVAPVDAILKELGIQSLKCFKKPLTSKDLKEMFSENNNRLLHEMQCMVSETLAFHLNKHGSNSANGQNRNNENGKGDI